MCTPRSRATSRPLNVDWGLHVRQGDTLAVLQIPELEQQLQLDESAYDVAALTYSRLSRSSAHGPNSWRKKTSMSRRESRSPPKPNSTGTARLYSYSRITAPFDGVVTRLDAYKGALLPAGTSSDKGNLALCHLSDNSVLRLVIPVPERAVPLVRTWRVGRGQVSSLNRAFNGKIARFSEQIDPATRTMHTEVQVPNPRFELVPGMYASVDIPLRVDHGVLAVPIQAVQLTAEGKGTVLLVDARIESRRRTSRWDWKRATEVEIVRV